MPAVAGFSCTNPSRLSTLLMVLTKLMNNQTPADLNSPNSLQDQSRYDFIIVGAGAAGCVLANRLSERPDWNILLLEAGGEEPFESDVPAYLAYTWGTRLDWGYRTQPEPQACGNQPCNWVRGKVLGGSTVVHAMIYNRGNRRDYDHWQQLGNHGWDFKNVLPYFKKSENNLDPDIAADTEYHNIGGYQSVGRFPFHDQNVDALIKGFNELGYPSVDINGKQVRGVMLMQTTQNNGERQSTNHAFLTPVRQRKNLKVVTNVRVTKLLIDPKTKAAYGVEYAHEQNRRTVRRAFSNKEVIVSGGTINTPQLLMLSGIGPKEVLTPLGIPVLADLKVGFNLQDHVSTTALQYELSSKSETEVTDEEMEKDMRLFNQTRRTGPLASTGAGQVTAYTNSRYGNKNIDYPDIQYLFRPAISRACPTDLLKPPCYYSAFTPTPVVTRPKSRGRITINTTDPFSPPLIYPKYFTDSERHDINVLTDSLNEAMRLANTGAFKNLGITLNTTPVQGCERFKFASDQYWECAFKRNTATYFHYAGTCKMGPANDRDAVVDPTLKVKGISKLRVIDASIMPTVVSGTIVAPVIMIGEKGADLIKHDWQGGNPQRPTG
ncbi:Glucose dehydrogenase [FAD, quinone] [Blattella germanica]|nr:Glucose dehydrogenase [FAD, quinone] [Blattella germanica]